eukprot:Gb_16855 [translate_table: standard]
MFYREAVITYYNPHIILASTLTSFANNSISRRRENSQAIHSRKTKSEFRLSKPSKTYHPCNCGNAGHPGNNKERGFSNPKDRNHNPRDLTRSVCTFFVSLHPRSIPIQSPANTAHNLGRINC